MVVRGNKYIPVNLCQQQSLRVVVYPSADNDFCMKESVY